MQIRAINIFVLDTLIRGHIYNILCFYNEKYPVYIS